MRGYLRAAGTLLWGLGLVLATSGRAPAEVVAPDSVRALDARFAAERGLSLPPLEAEGDIHFTVDAAVLFDAQGQYSLETYLLVPHVGLDWVRSGQQYRAELEIDITAWEHDRRRSRSLTTKKSIIAPSFEETRRIDASTTVTLSGGLLFRPEHLDVEVRDLRSTKNTLFGRIQGANRSGQARLALPRGRGGSQDDELSSLVFATGSERDESETPPEGAISHGGVVLHPNPTHFVGRDLAVFPVYFEVYQRTDAGGYRGEPEPRSLRYRVTTLTGEELLTADDAIEATSGRWGRVQRFDVSEFPTGTYVLFVELRSDGGDELLDVAYGEFHVLWRDYTWTRDEATVLEEAEVLLTPEEFDRFERMLPGQRAAFLAQLWDQVDGAPDAETTGVREKFRRRLGRAEKLYGGIEGGTRSDRGRILIRYGEPQEVIPVRIPSRRETFEEVVASELSGSLSNTVDLEDPRLISFFRRVSRGNPAFEIWKYYGSGDPILESHRGPARGMAFIFVDETGVGVYQLGYTNVRGIN